MTNILHTAYLGSAQANKNVAAALANIDEQLARQAARAAAAAEIERTVTDRRRHPDGSAS
jgi:hypothetical protein